MIWRLFVNFSYLSHPYFIYTNILYLTIINMSDKFGVFSLHFSASNCLLPFAYKNKLTYSSTSFNHANENY